MMEKRNRNGGSGRNRTDEPDDDLGPAEDDSVALKEPDAPARKPAVETASARMSGGGAKRLILLLAGDRRRGAALSLLGLLAERSGHPGRAAGARRHRRQADGQGDGGVGRFHRPVRGAESVEVRARVSGYLESVNFTDGQIVKRGDLLFVIEPRPFELALEIGQGRARADRGAGSAGATAARSHRAAPQERLRHQRNL